MRGTILVLVLALAGCFATQSSTNPLKRKAPEKAAKPAAAKAEPKPLPAPRPEPKMNKVELMEEMFLLQHDLNQQILKLAEKLSQTELMEFNQWLQPYGRQLRLKNPVKPKHNRRVF